ncbi:ArsR family transcriptional regulator [Alkalibaculum sp. M08DMB]|uniref:ArsR family transcriptional regulator n=1 Tax=Alkalibaculum sporogenes TaxID=2655001 RepID=A0A6A7K6V4_9FIRM|nr:transcriptional regulator [Alkalibaculum sporogenes]MPW24907.1 ArsR family transcriptional regulator [Alkalibaculum sporogenes]
MELTNIPEAFTLPLRISLISCLIDGQKTFNEIKEITKATDGNISVQLSKLQKWGYINSEKRAVNKYSQTIYSITQFGLDKLEEYVVLLEGIVRGTTPKAT